MQFGAGSPARAPSAAPRIASCRGAASAGDTGRHGVSRRRGTVMSSWPETKEPRAFGELRGSPAAAMSTPLRHGVVLFARVALRTHTIELNSCPSSRRTRRRHQDHRKEIAGRESPARPALTSTLLEIACFLRGDRERMPTPSVPNEARHVRAGLWRRAAARAPISAAQSATNLRERPYLDTS